MVIVQAAENHGDELGFADLSIDHKDCANLLRNSHKVFYETGHLVLSLKESYWKLRKLDDQNFRMEGKPL